MINGGVPNLRKFSGDSLYLLLYAALDDVLPRAGSENSGQRGEESSREQNEGRTSGPGTIHLGSQVQSPDAATPDLSQN